MSIELNQELTDTTTLDCLAGGGEMGALMRSMDWSQTPLGPVATWPQSLRTAVSICLNSRFPILIWWGPEFIKLYNDSYRTIISKKHPKAMGQRGRECWPEIWHIIGPMLDGVMTQGRATWSEDQLLLLDRNGYLEECYFTFSYSPIRDETGNIGGIFTAVTETTERVLGERRLRTLRDLAAHAAIAETVEQVCSATMRTLAKNAADIPFSLLYLLESDGKSARLAGAAGLEAGTLASPILVEFGPDAGADSHGDGAGAAPWPLDQVVRTGQPAQVDDGEGYFGVPPGGPWPESPHTSLVLPVARASQDIPYGLLVVGISPRRPLDEDYRSFLTLVAGQIAAAIANARALEEERQRAAALAEIDRAKTEFFSNISHEFRTPLTLMLGPVQDILAAGESWLTAEQRERLEIVQRNGLRLLKLVNHLLDFSRMEAGRMQADYESTDLAALTANLVSVFRAAIEQAGLRLVVDCPPLPEPVYVDRDMWEKIVLNLISNAFKFTFKGEITVRLRSAGSHVQLEVCDTGVGIPQDQLPYIFERFHRVRGLQARTYEGSGIGLALVKELVSLHGGTVEVTSTAGQGTTFAVSLPTGSAHLPADRIGATRSLESTSVSPAAYVEEALRWLPSSPQLSDIVQDEITPRELQGDGQPARSALSRHTDSATILLADDNADMRDYLAHLLSQRWAVEMAADGAAALAAVRERLPDLVIADVMMPGMDGFELLRQLRADPTTRDIPIILLSARAGEASRVEGLEAGADDYLVKPFSARELLARVEARLEARRESGARFQTIFDTAATGIALLDLEGRYLQVNPAFERMLGYSRAELLGKSFQAVTHPDDLARDAQRYQELVEGSINYYQLQKRYVRKDGEITWALLKRSLVKDKEGNAQFVIGMNDDITEQKRVEEALRESEARFRAVFDGSATGIALQDIEGRYLTANPAFRDMVGYSTSELRTMTFVDLVHPSEAQRDKVLFKNLVAGLQANYRIERRYRRKEGAWIWARITRSVIRSAEGDPQFVICLAEDFTDRKRVEAELADVRRKLIENVEAERLYLSQEIHDGPIQDMYGMIFHIADIVHALPKRLSPKLGPELSELEHRANQVIDELRKICTDLRPPTLTHFGLEKAIASHAETFQQAHPELDVHLDLATDGPMLSERVRLALFRVYQQALANVIRHAQASQVFVRLMLQQDSVVLEIQDNGSGFIVPEQLISLSREGHLGLIGSAERIDAIGGTFQVESEPGKGVLIRASVPLRTDQ